MLHLFGGCDAEGERGIVDSFNQFYCLMTPVLNPLIQRMQPEDSLYEIFKPEH